MSTSVKQKYINNRYRGIEAIRAFNVEDFDRPYHYRMFFAVSEPNVPKPGAFININKYKLFKLIDELGFIKYCKENDIMLHSLAPQIMSFAMERVKGVREPHAKIAQNGAEKHFGKLFDTLGEIVDIIVRGNDIVVKWQLHWLIDHNTQKPVIFEMPYNDCTVVDVYIVPNINFNHKKGVKLKMSESFDVYAYKPIKLNNEHVMKLYKEGFSEFDMFDVRGFGSSLRILPDETTYLKTF